jgi:hypothetical protein
MGGLQLCVLLPEGVAALAILIEVIHPTTSRHNRTRLDCAVTQCIFTD